MIREEVAKYGKGGYVTPRGAKFELAEVGYKYDWNACQDPILEQLESEVNSLKDRLKQRQEFLKTVPKEGIDIIFDGGEVCRIYPPIKTSTSSYKVTLPK
jgi:hypothetical protein